MFTMKQAANEVGVSKSTISRAIKNGRVSATKDDTGVYHIEPAELFRVYPRTAATRFNNAPMTRDAPPAEAAALNAEIAGLKAQLDLMRETLDDAKEERTAWQKQAESSQRLLADASPKRRSWFGFGG